MLFQACASKKFQIQAAHLLQTWKNLDKKIKQILDDNDINQTNFRNIYVYIQTKFRYDLDQGLGEKYSLKKYRNQINLDKKLYKIQNLIFRQKIR